MLKDKVGTPFKLHWKHGEKHINLGGSRWTTW